MPNDVKDWTVGERQTNPSAIHMFDRFRSLEITRMLLLRVFLPFACGYFLSYLYRVVNAVIAPDLIRDAGLSADGLGMLTSAYFLTFAAFQLPLGVLLDRFGPRRTEAVLLLFAAAGAVAFAMAQDPTGLVIGRAMIGFGVSACLMAAFKAFVIWFPQDRLPLVNGCQMAAGGLGALTATTPVELALTIADWRGVFFVLAALTVAVALLILFVVPEREGGKSNETLRQQLLGLKSVFSSSLFWRAAPMTILSQASFLAIQGLWSGPWLRDVAGLDRDGVANTLFLVALAMIAGFVTMGMIAERLSRAGIPPLFVSVAGMIMFAVVQVIVIMQWTAAVAPVWMAFGFFGTCGIIPYAALSQRFPPRLAGRLNTSLNLPVFVVAFAAQWGIGTIIDLWPTTETGGYHPAGYQTAFGLMLALQVLAVMWFLFFRRQNVPAN